MKDWQAKAHSVRHKDQQYWFAYAKHPNHRDKGILVSGVGHFKKENALHEAKEWIAGSYRRLC